MGIFAWPPTAVLSLRALGVGCQRQVRSCSRPRQRVIQAAEEVRQRSTEMNPSLKQQMSARSRGERHRPFKRRCRQRSRSNSQQEWPRSWQRPPLSRPLSRCARHGDALSRLPNDGRRWNCFTTDMHKPYTRASGGCADPLKLTRSPSSSLLTYGVNQATSILQTAQSGHEWSLPTTATEAATQTSFPKFSDHSRTLGQLQGKRTYQRVPNSDSRVTRIELPADMTMRAWWRSPSTMAMAIVFGMSPAKPAGCRFDDRTMARHS